MPVTVIDKLPTFSKSLRSVYEDALAEGARDALIKARNRAPFKHGPLRANSDHHSVAPLLQRISFWIEYARFQEFGGDGSRRVRNYTTAGTGAHFLQQAGDEELKNLPARFLKHGVRAHA